MNFKSISNEELLRELRHQVEYERKLLMEILHALREVEARKLHLEMGYPDLYTFAIKELDPKSGRACQSRHGLQFDHIVAFSQGGSNQAGNLTLRCGAHNRYRAEQMGL